MWKGNIRPGALGGDTAPAATVVTPDPRAVGTAGPVVPATVAVAVVVAAVVAVLAVVAWVVGVPAVLPPGPPGGERRAASQSVDVLIVEPARVELRLAPGQAACGSVVVSNRGRRTLRVRAESSTAVSAAAGVGAVDRSSVPCVSLGLSPPEFSLRPGRTRTVAYRVEVSGQAAEGEHRVAAVLTGSAVGRRGPAQAQVQALAQAVFFVNLPPVRRSALVAALLAAPSPAGGPGVILRVRSGGNASVRFCGTVELTGPLPARQVTYLVFGEHEVPPGEEADICLRWEGRPLAPGRYEAAVRLRYLPPAYPADAAPVGSVTAASAPAAPGVWAPATPAPLEHDSGPQGPTATLVLTVR